MWIFDLDRGLDVALTEGGSGQHNPIWSPDGTHIVYRSGDDIMVRPVDRSTVLEPVTSTDQPDNPIEWLADGTLIVSTEGERSGDLFALNGGLRYRQTADGWRIRAIAPRPGSSTCEAGPIWKERSWSRRGKRT